MTLPKTMRAMVTMGHGGLEQIVLQEDWPCPRPGPGEVLVRVGACGLNNTDVNTRSGWYSRSVRDATSGAGFAATGEEEPSWGGSPIRFPRIQGADVCGRIVAVGAGVNPDRVGTRVISDPWLRDPAAPDDKEKAGYFGSESDGGFAEYTVMPTLNARAVVSTLTDAELATFSCSYSTAEGMLTRASVTRDDTVLVPGASGGVGGALVQLAKRRGARVIAMASDAKHTQVKVLGPDVILPRAPANLRAALKGEKVSVVADVVGGPYWPALIDALARGGRYVCSGAIAGPMVELDLRILYLRDLSFFGSTVIPPEIMTHLIKYIEAGEISPNLAATFALEDLRTAQTAFLQKNLTGNIVVIP